MSLIDWHSSIVWSLWPAEVWRLLTDLDQQVSQPGRTRQPQVRLTARKYPDYVSPTGQHRIEFNEVLQILEAAKIISVERQRNASEFAERVRLVSGQESELRKVLAQNPQWIPPSESTSNFNIANSSNIRLAILETLDQYGTLGLRTAAHLALGDSHLLDGRSLDVLGLAQEERLWQHTDATQYDNAGLVRVGGRLKFRGPSFYIEDRWSIPGHYVNLWAWDKEKYQVESIGSTLWLVENMYPFWELLRRWEGQDITLLCLHGETRLWAGRDSGLATFLGAVYRYAPELKTLIWCDPDPGGLEIAANAQTLVTQLGGKANFRYMTPDVLEKLQQLILSAPPLKPLTIEDRQLLEQTAILPSELDALRYAMLDRNMKGEQEALVLLAESQ